MNVQILSLSYTLYYIMQRSFTIDYCSHAYSAHLVFESLMCCIVYTRVTFYGDFCVLCSCCGAGTAADTEMTTLMISSQVELLRLNSKHQPRVVTAATRLKQMLFRYV